ncbi:MAG: hypothetical protein EBQ80_02500 [Proteobacteria bacterium]|nr:hypothetical protein [Pseudomonadota bacterium]
MVLPVKPAVAATGAKMQLVLEQPELERAMPFFGGYAEDFLADMGLDMVDDLPAAKPSAVKRV